MQIDSTIDYFNTLFKHKAEDEFIKIGLRHKDNGAFTYKYFNNIKDCLSLIDTAKHIYDLYCGISTYTDKHGSEEYLHTRYAIAFDFDKKDGICDYKDVFEKFKKYRLFYHLMIDSGNGYHVYLFIEPTVEIERVNKLNKFLGELIGSDCKALNSTQILRIPGTFNYKNDKQKPVNKIFKANLIRNYTLQELEERFYKFQNNSKGENYINKIIQSNLFCVDRMLLGVDEGQRNFCEGRLVQYFKSRGIQKDITKNIIIEWNNRCDPPKDESQLLSDFETFWQDKYRGFLACNFKENDKFQEILLNYCDKAACKKPDKNDSFIIGEDVIQYKNKIMEDMNMDGYHLIVLGILEIFHDGLLMSDIQKKLTSAITGKAYISRNTLINILNELILKKYITCSEGKKMTQNFYKINDKIWNKTGLTPINYGTIRRIIELDISSVTFRVLSYIYYRKRQCELSKDRQYISYDDIAKGIGIDSKNVNIYLKTLEEKEFIKIERYYNEITTMWYNNIILLP